MSGKPRHYVADFTLPNQQEPDGPKSLIEWRVYQETPDSPPIVTLTERPENTGPKVENCTARMVNLTLLAANNEREGINKFQPETVFCILYVSENARGDGAKEAFFFQPMTVTRDNKEIVPFEKPIPLPSERVSAILSVEELKNIRETSQTPLNELLAQQKEQEKNPEKDLEPEY